MANKAPCDARFVAGVSAGPYILGKFNDVAYWTMPEELHVLVVSCFKLRFAQSKVIFSLIIAVY